MTMEEDKSCAKCYYLGASNECGHCSRFWSVQDAREMGLDGLEDLWISRERVLGNEQ